MGAWGCGSDDQPSGDQPVEAAASGASSGSGSGSGAGASGSTGSGGEAASGSGGSATGGGGAAACALPPIPGLDTWEANVEQFGDKACANYDAPGTTPEEHLGDTYYDAIRVFLEAEAYTGDSKWGACADKAKVAYRDTYVLPNNGAVPGYWNFTTGLTMDAITNGDTVSEDAVNALAMHAAYSADGTPLEWIKGCGTSREVAYALRAHINAEKLGADPRPYTTELVDVALGHIDQWFISKTYRCPADCDPAEAAGTYYIQPFMVGLTTEALIMWEEKTGDPRVQPAIEVALEWLWTHAWVPENKGFWYDNWVANPDDPFPATGGAPDLNQLIAPAYAWLYRRTCDPAWLERADQIFQGGVEGAWLDGSKQFNQNYCWSFEFVALRTK
jgi:hypothetical protein